MVFHGKKCFDRLRETDEAHEQLSGMYSPLKAQASVDHRVQRWVVLAMALLSHIYREGCGDRDGRGQQNHDVQLG